MKKGSRKRDQGRKTDIEGRQGRETSEGCGGELQKLMGFIHGRCDVGSPFATGKLFDLEEDAADS